MWIKQIRKYTALLVLIAFAAAACGGSGDSDLTSPGISDETESNDTTSTVDPADDATVEFEPIDEAEFDQDLEGAVFQQFVDLMAAADIYRINPDDKANFIQDVGGPDVLAELDRQRADDLSSGVFTPAEMESLVDNPTVELTDDQIAARDCVEQTVVGTNGNEVIKFVDLTATMRLVDGVLWVESLTVNHPGGTFEGIGCTTLVNGQNALEVAEQLHAVLASAQADPAAGLPADLEALLSDSAAEELRASLVELAAAGQRVVQDGVEVSYRVLGRDGDVLGDNVVVEMCTKFVNGLQLVSTTGAGSTEVFGPGESQATNLTVWSNGEAWKISSVSGFVAGECG